MQKSHCHQRNALRLRRRKMTSIRSKAMTQQHCYKMSWHRPHTEKDSCRCSWTRWKMTLVSFGRSFNSSPTCRSFSATSSGALHQYGNERWNNATVSLLCLKGITYAVYWATSLICCCCAFIFVTRHEISALGSTFEVNFALSSPVK